MVVQQRPAAARHRPISAEHQVGANLLAAAETHGHHPPIGAATQGLETSPFEEPAAIQPAPQDRQQPGTVEGQGSRLEAMLGDGLALRRDQAGVLDRVGFQFPVGVHPEGPQGLEAPGQQQKTEALMGRRLQPLTQQRCVAMGLPPAHSERQACHTGTDD